MDSIAQNCVNSITNVQELPVMSQAIDIHMFEYVHIQPYMYIHAI